MHDKDLEVAALSVAASPAAGGHTDLIKRLRDTIGAAHVVTDSADMPGV